MRQQAADWLLRVRQAPEDERVIAARDAWLAADAAHADAYAEAELVWRLAGMTRPAFQNAPKGRTLRRRVRSVAVACGALAACLTIAMVPDIRLRLTADHMTTVGKTERVTLPDGSLVDLDAKSAVAVHYSGTQREIDLLNGRAFFDVAYGDPRAFRVMAGGLAVTVTGTAFEVTYAPKSVSIDVQRGSVKVSVSKDHEFSLAVGERLTFDREHKSTVIGPAVPDQIATWRSGRLSVDGRSVGDVIDEFRRYYPGIILMPNHELADRRVTGVFDLTNPASALRAVVAPYAGQVIQITPYILLVRAG